jgi:excisionase family DNA binding protein
MHIPAHYCVSMLGISPGSERTENMYLRYKDLSEELGISLRTLKSWVAARLIPYVKVNRLVLFEPAKVKAALEKLERKAK